MELRLIPRAVQGTVWRSCPDFRRAAGISPQHDALFGLELIIGDSRLGVSSPTGRVELLPPRHPELCGAAHPNARIGWIAVYRWKAATGHRRREADYRRRSCLQTCDYSLYDIRKGTGLFRFLSGRDQTN